MPAVTFHRLSMRHPGDVAPLRALFHEGMRPGDVVALWCKTAGHGLANDVTRPYAELCLLQCLAEASGDDFENVRSRVQVIVSGGCEGAIVPHLIVVSLAHDPGAGTVIGAVVACDSAEIADDLVGTPAHAELTRAMVAAAGLRAGIEAPTDIRFVMVRAPAPSTSPAALAAARHAAALGVAWARGDPIDRFPGVLASDGGPAAFVVARPGDHVQHIVILGHAKGGSARWRIGSTALRDPLDAPAIAQCLAELGLPLEGVQLSPAQSSQIGAAFVKGDVPPSVLRGYPHAMADDPLLVPHRHARAAYGAMAATVLGMPACFVSAGAEGHGPEHGGSFAAVITA